jgi:hypothetical protein
MRLFAATVALVLVACNTGKSAEPKPDPGPAPAPSPSAAKQAGGQAVGALHLGAPIEASAKQVALSEVAKAPQSYVGQTFATTGTVTAVCQHMGCWMEIKDDASSAHIKMAGHGFFVPKTASGHKARILAKLDKPEDEGSCEGEGKDGMSAQGGHKDGKGCRAEAEQQLGRPLAKLELVAEGVELM